MVSFHLFYFQVFVVYVASILFLWNSKEAFGWLSLIDVNWEKRIISELKLKKANKNTNTTLHFPCLIAVDHVCIFVSLLNSCFIADMAQRVYGRQLSVNGSWLQLSKRGRGRRGGRCAIRRVGRRTWSCALE